MADCAAWLSGISTKPKPLARPVSRPVTTHLVHGTIRLEELSEVVISGSKRKIPDKDIHAGVLW